MDGKTKILWWALIPSVVVGLLMVIVGLFGFDGPPPVSAQTDANSHPDLEVGTPSVYDATLYTGNRFTLSVTVTNAGDGASEATTLRYYRSTDSTITSSDTAQGSESVGTLAAAGTSDHDGGMTAPSEAGTYYYGACVDSVTDESDTTNNCSSSVRVTVSEPAPDLVVIGIDASDNIVTGGSFRVGVTVTNQGDAQSAATTLRWKQEVDGTTTEIGTAAQRALTRPQGSFKTIRLTAPSTPGTSSYWACVDSVAGESDTTNNCSGKVTVTVTNNLATGAPTIGGTAQVGQTLTASTSGIADTDGLTSVTYSYQWLADDADIDGATSSTYTVQSSDNGKVIKVRVTFTDNEDNEETLTSEPTAAVAARVTIDDDDSSSTSRSGGGGGGGGGGRSSSSGSVVFTDGAIVARSVAENTVPDPNDADADKVGEPVVATDANSNPLAYSLGGADAALFTIDERTGQLRVGAGTALDYEITSSYAVTVVATGDRGSRARITVIILVTDVGMGPYDADNNEVIDRDEVLAAIADYLQGVISKEEALAVINRYFST